MTLPSCCGQLGPPRQHFSRLTCFIAFRCILPKCDTGDYDFPRLEWTLAKSNRPYSYARWIAGRGREERGEGMSKQEPDDPAHLNQVK